MITLAVTLVFGGIPFALGRYIEVKSPDPFDSGAYVYSAKHLLQGARLGVDEVASASPGTLIVNIIGVKLFGFNDVGPKVVQMVMQAAALAFLFFTLYRLFGAVAAAVSTIMACIYLSAPLIAKGGNVKEQYMIALMIAAACCFLWYESGGRRWRLAACGFFAIQPFYFKPTGLSILIALGGYILVSGILRKDWKKLWLDLVIFLAAAAAGLLVPASLYIWQHTLATFLRTLPVLAIETALIVLLLFAAAYYVVAFARRIRLWQHLHNVTPRLYRWGAAAIIIMLVISILLVAAANRQAHRYPTVGAGTDVIAYLKSIPFVAFFLKIYIITQMQLQKLLAAAGLKGGYVEYSWQLIKVSELAQKIGRYYKALSVPILMAVVSIVTAAVVCVRNIFRKQPSHFYDRAVWMMAAWWCLDMAFVWISPHSYEQYYLPLCGSGAVLASYAVWKWQQNLTAAAFKIPWGIAGAVVAIVLASLAVPIFIGQRYSPDVGPKLDYVKRDGHRSRGFADALTRVKADQAYPWQEAGKYINASTTPQDTIYVWGWMPGIYVEAQRMAPVPQAFEANMHFTPPQDLGKEARQLVEGFEKRPPKFIVDTRKLHFPFNRPPLELWPMVPERMFGNPQSRPLNPANPAEVAAYDRAWKQFLSQRYAADEAQRYDAMEPFRQYVMNHYRFVRQFGAGPYSPIVFERVKNNP